MSKLTHQKLAVVKVNSKPLQVGRICETMLRSWRPKSKRVNLRVVDAKRRQ
jgi:hypothetical protein